MTMVGPTTPPVPGKKLYELGGRNRTGSVIDRGLLRSVTTPATRSEASALLTPTVDRTRKGIRRAEPSKLLMAAIAEGRVTRALALAEGDPRRLIKNELSRHKPRSFVRSVAEGLFPGPSASAPVVSSRF